MYAKLPLEQLLNLSGKTAIVTGSAGGIGEAIAERLHEAGANVIVADVNEAGAQTVATRLNEHRANSSIASALDVTRSDQVQAVVQQAVSTFGSLDILVNNAGIFPFVSLADLTEETFNKVIDVNLRGVYLLTKAATEEMKRQDHGGKVINITSIDAIHPSMVGLAPYDASKHAVWGFTKNIALELAPHGISVNALAPGGISTPGTGSLDGEPAAGVEAFIKLVPMGRMGYADEIGKATLFLASDMASYMTGEQVVVDGGRLLG